jgi:undecaprenyl-diphosphatase
MSGRSLHAPRAISLVLSLILLILIGVGLRSLSRLMSGEDLALVRDLAGQRSGLLTALAHGISWLGRSGVLVLCAALIAVGAIRRGKPVYGAVMIVGVVGALILQTVDKVVIGRPRPPVPHLEHVTGTSFPSGHATNASAFFVLVALGIVLASRSRPVKLLAAFTAIVVIGGVAWSRVYLGVHYPTDVVAGILLGGSWSLVTATVLLRAGSDR